MESFSIIAIGNPGAGKSTTLNYLAQEVVFKSGVAIGSGLTFEFDKRTVNNITYCDTPGLNDAGKREAAGKAITEALKEGGKTKILFFIGQESGRPKQDDVTTMNLVLKSAPEIGNNYGVILPKIKKKMTKTFEKLDAWTTFLAGLFAGLEEKHRECPVGNVQGVQLIESLDDEDNVLAAKGELKTLENHPLENFVFNVLPFIDLTPDQAEDIDTTTFEQKQSEIVELIEKSKSDDAKMKSLQEQVEKSRDGSGTLQKALSVAAPIFGCLAKIAAPKLGGRTGEIADVLAIHDTLNGPNAIAAFIPFFAANINLLVNTFKVEEDMLKGDKDKHLKDILIGLIISSIVLQFIAGILSVLDTFNICKTPWAGKIVWINGINLLLCCLNISIAAVDQGYEINEKQENGTIN